MPKNQKDQKKSNISFYPFENGCFPFINVKQPFMVFHIETSGLDPDLDYIMEFASWQVGKKCNDPVHVKCDWSEEVDSRVLYTKLTKLHKTLFSRTTVDLPKDYDVRYRYENERTPTNMLKQIVKLFNYCSIHNLPIVMHSAYRFILPFLEAHLDKYLDMDILGVLDLDNVLDISSVYRFLHWQDLNPQNASSNATANEVENWHTYAATVYYGSHYYGSIEKKEKTKSVSFE